MRWKRPLVHATMVKPLDGFKAHVVFDNGEEREIDLEMYLHGPIFQPIRDDPAMFQAMYIEHGAITWPNEADIDPDTLYYNLTPAWMMDEDDSGVSARPTQARDLSWADILRGVSALNLADKATLISIISDQIADAVERLEAREPAMAVREEQAPYQTDTGKS